MVTPDGPQSAAQIAKGHLLGDVDGCHREAVSFITIDIAHDGSVLSAALQLAVQRCNKLVAFRP